MTGGMERWINVPLVWVVAFSLAVGAAMPVVFRHTSDQKRIRGEKNRIKAHLLAVRLFPGQLTVVLRAYVRIVWGTVRYLRLAIMPVALIVAPLTLLIAQGDLYLGFEPFVPGEPFLLTVQTTTPEQAELVVLTVPPEIAITASPVHIPADREVVWRLEAKREGDYNLMAELDGQRVEKTLVVSRGMRRVSPIRLRGQIFMRMLVSGERALPGNSEIESIELAYPPRTIPFTWWKWNWIWLFLILSLITGWITKTVLRIEV
jgi:hypothetical protein